MPPTHQVLPSDVANIQARLRIADQLPERRDIRKHAASLIALQDEAIDLNAIRLSRREHAIGRYIGQVIGCPAYAEDEKAPVGIKLPPLFFSPLFHFERARRTDPADASCHIHLPKTVDELEEYLHEAMSGIFRDGEEEAERRREKIASGAIETESLALWGAANSSGCIIEEPQFEQLTGVTIRSLAELLFTIRGADPALFLLLLSFDIEEAVRAMPSLDESRGGDQASQWRKAHLSNAKCTIASAFEIIRIFRRGADIVSALTVRNHFTISAVREVLARLRKGTSLPSDRHMLETICISTYGLRKIVLNDIDRHHAVLHDPKRRAFRRRGSDYGTLHSLLTCVIGSDTAYAAEAVGDWLTDATANLPETRLPTEPSRHSAINVSRISGAGKNQQDQLATFYGYTCRDLVILTAIEAVAVIGHGKLIRLTGRVATLVYRKLLDGKKDIRSDQVMAVKKTIPHVFPASGHFRHSCGFARSSWTDLEADATDWCALAEGSAGSAFGDSYAGLFLATRRYLHGYSYQISRRERLASSARIFCHLSHTLGSLAQDPVWIRLLDRAKFIAGINARNTSVNSNRLAMFGTGPHKLEQLVREVR